MARLTAMDVTVLSLGSDSVLGFWESATYNYENLREEGKSASTKHANPTPVGAQSSIEINAMVEEAADLIESCRTDPLVTVNFTLDGTALTAPGLIATGDLTIARNALQMQKIKIEFKADATAPGP